MNTTALDHLVEHLDIEEVTNYFALSGWMETKTEFTLRFSYQNQTLKHPVFELAGSRDFADFNFRLRQVIEGLSIVESRPAINVFIDMLADPKSAVIRKISENRLRLSSGAAISLNLLLEATSSAATFVESDDGYQFEKKFVGCIAETCNFLASESRLEGMLADKQAALLNICQRLLLHALRCFYTPPSKADFWNAAAANNSQHLIQKAKSLRMSPSNRLSNSENKSHAAADD